MLPALIGSTGIVLTTLWGPLWYRVLAYVAVGCTLLVTLVGAMRMVHEDLAKLKARKDISADVETAEAALQELERARRRGDLEASRDAASKAQEAVRRARLGMSNAPESGETSEERETPGPTRQHVDSDVSSAIGTRAPPDWWLVASMAVAAAISLAVDRRRRKGHRSQP